MGLFTKYEVKEAEKKLENVKVGHRLEKGKLKKELSTKEAQVEKLESKLASQIEVSESKLADLTTERDHYKGLENDRVAIEASKRVIKVTEEDLAEDKKLLEHRTKRLEKREERLEVLENDEFKKGYSDGLADGLRKAHEITREDRKYLTMIAMSTNQSEAIKTSQKALEGGFKDEPADSKS